MQTTAIQSTGGTNSTASHATGDRGVASLKSEDFFRILISELRQQDPFEPAKTADMISQVSQIRGIELNGQLTTTLDQITKQQRTAGAGDMLGKHVTAEVTAPNGAKQSVSGVVTGVRFNPDGAAMLELDSGAAIAASLVTRVTTVEQAEHDALMGENSGGNVAAPAGGSAPAAKASAAKQKWWEKLLAPLATR